MQRLNLTLPTPAENVALDEALLHWAEEQKAEAEFFRIWESPQPIVVVGRSSRIAAEVDERACSDRDIPVLRRSSGGAAIVAGPGCLMYAIVLDYGRRPELRDITRTHAFVLDRLADSLQPLVAQSGTITRAGTSDLVISDCKFSGNSMRAKRTHLLYHGTLLYDFDLTLIETCLRMPPRQPEYRQSRSHQQFVANLPVSQEVLVDAIERAWPTESDVNDWPAERVATLVAERFGRPSWNREFV
jgi:lipoate---protein ligase